jgi:hydroxyacylglutathione hydrolase
MEILTAAGGVATTNCYLIADDSARVAVLFDAPDHTVAPLLAQARDRGWEIIGLWLTHGHFDHLADHALVKAAFPKSKLLIHPLDEPRLRNPHSSMFPLPFVIPPGVSDAHFSDNQELSIGSIPVRVMHTPGHSPGHVMFHLPDHDILIGGDLIFAGSIGRTDLPGANHAVLESSIRRIMKLSPQTRLLSGHGQPTTLEQEAQSNPYIQAAMSGKD